MTLLRDYWAAVSGNVLAEPLCAVLAAIVVWPLRHKIGRRAAAWWAKHHHEHAVQAHLDALTRYAGGEDGRVPVPEESK